MRLSKIKVTYLLSGTFYRAEALELDNNDAGETWAAASGQHPIIDGSGQSNAAFTINSAHISIRGIVITGFLKYGFFIRNSSYITIADNFISDIWCSGWNQGAVVLFENISHVAISNNSIQDVNYAGIFYANSNAAKLVNLRIEFNKLIRTCVLVKDCGAIHVDDRSHSASGVLIAENTIGNHGPQSNETKAIYLDDLLSNAVVRNNVIFGTGTYAFQIHGGDHNVFAGNIADISEMQALGIYWQIGGTQRDFGMSENTFKCNVVYSSGRTPEHMWVSKVSPADEALSIHDNVYWDTHKILNPLLTGDTSPHFRDPQFIDPGAQDFRFRSAIKLPACGTIGAHVNRF